MDWAVGDLALCVDASPPRDVCGDGGIETHYARNLVEGRIYRVDQVVACRCGNHMGLGERASKAGGDVNRFRKIRPDELEACEPEFVTLIRRLDPAQPFPLHFPKVAA